MCVVASLNPRRRTAINVVNSAECRQAVGLPLITVCEPNTISPAPVVTLFPFILLRFLSSLVIELIYHVFVIALV